MSALHIDYDSDDMQVDSDAQSPMHDADADADADSDEPTAHLDVVSDSAARTMSLYSRPVRCISLLVCYQH